MFSGTIAVFLYLSYDVGYIRARIFLGGVNKPDNLPAVNLLVKALASIDALLSWDRNNGLIIGNIEEIIFEHMIKDIVLLIKQRYDSLGRQVTGMPIV